MNNTMARRLFIAINLPEEAKNALSAVQDSLIRLNPHLRVRWVNTAILHLTLHFLGEVGEGRIAQAKNILAGSVKGVGKFDVALGKLGGFPDERRPRIIWVGLTEKTGTLNKLHAGLRQGLINAGFDADLRRFTPHLTLGRATVPQVFRGLDSPVESYQSRRFGKSGSRPQAAGFTVRSVELMESKLYSNGPQYSTIMSVPLLE